MSMKLIDALLGEPDEKEFRFGEHVVVMRTLKQSEINDVMNRITRADLTMIELEKIPTLAKSIVSIDGISPVAFDEIRSKLDKDKSANITVLIEETLSEMDSGTINILFGFYSSLREESLRRKEELKKNSPVRSVEHSSKSANSSK